MFIGCLALSNCLVSLIVKERLGRMFIPMARAILLFQT